jgi:hypothetical protein
MECDRYVDFFASLHSAHMLWLLGNINTRNNISNTRKTNFINVVFSNGIFFMSRTRALIVKRDALRGGEVIITDSRI